MRKKVMFPHRNVGVKKILHQWFLFWVELDKFKCLEGKCREKPWKVRARTYGTKSPSRSEALRFIDSAKSPSTKIDGSLVNFRRRLSNRHGRPRRMLTMDIRRTPIGLWARLRDSHKSGPQSGSSLAWTLAQRNDWSGKMAWVRHSSTWVELDKFKCLEAKCREKPWKVRNEPSIFVDGDLAESIKRSASDRLGDLVP